MSLQTKTTEDTKVKQFQKNGRLPPLSPSPLEHRKKNNPATLCQARLILGCACSSFSHLKCHPVGTHRWLQHNQPGVLQEEPVRQRERQRERGRERGRERQREAALLLFHSFGHKSTKSRHVHLLSQSGPSLADVHPPLLCLCPRVERSVTCLASLFTVPWVTSSYGPSLLPTVI